MAYPLVVWENTNYTGQSANINYGSYATTTLVTIPTKTISSLQVAAWTQVILYDGVAYTGSSITINGPAQIPDLSTYSTNFNDKTQSIAVTQLIPTTAQQMSCCNGTTSPVGCGQYVPGSATCTSAITANCTSQAGLSTAFCQSWCKDNPAICDTAVNTWCNTHPTDPYCSCLKSPAQVKGIINPKCVDQKCITGGYLTTDMINSNCPSVVTCTIKNSLTNSGVIISNEVPITQNCGNTTIISGSGTTSTPNPASTSTVTSTQTGNPPISGTGSVAGLSTWQQITELFSQLSLNIKDIILVLIFIMIVILGICGAVYLRHPARRHVAWPIMSK